MSTVLVCQKSEKLTLPRSLAELNPISHWLGQGDEIPYTSPHTTIHTIL